MGVESFVLHIVPEGVVPVPVKAPDGSPATAFRGRSEARTAHVLERMEITLAGHGIPLNFLSEQNKIIIDNAIELQIAEDEGFFRRATLIGCFAWYDEGLSLCYQIARVINSCVDIQVYHQLTGFMRLAGEERFCEAIQRAYQHKYSEFLRTYGDIRGKTLPDKDFYDFYHSVRGTPSKGVLGILRGAWRR